MGYHDAREIPNYWKYAENFVLDDHMFESDASWSLPAHLYLVSDWSARCSRPGDPSSCVNDDELGGYQTRADRRRRRHRPPGRRRGCIASSCAARRAVLAASLGIRRRAAPGAGRSPAPCARAPRLAAERGSSAASIGARARLARLDTASYNYAWTDLTYLLHKHGVSWGYFITPGREPDCEGGNANCAGGAA